MNYNRLTKCIFLVLCCMLIIGDIIAFNSYSGQYTASIYSRLIPIIFLFEVVISGVFLWYIRYLKNTDHFRKTSLWVGFIIFIGLCARLMILYLPYISGIVGWPADHNTHSIYIYEVVTTGGIPVTNFYPLSHIISAIINILADIPIQIITNYSIGIYFIVCLGGLYILAKALLNSPSIQKKYDVHIIRVICLLVLTISLIGVLTEYLGYYMPQGFSMLLYPIIFGVCISYINKSHLGFLVTAAIFIAPLSLCHPAGALFLFVAYLLYLIGSTLDILHSNKSLLLCYNHLRGYFPITILFVGMLTLFAFWTLALHSSFDANINSIYIQIIGVQDISDGLSDLSLKLDKSGLVLYEIILLGIKMYGFKIVVLLISLYSLVVLYTSRKINGLFSPALSGLFVATSGFVLFYGAYLIGIPGADSLAFGRFEGLLLIFTPIFLAFLLYHLVKNVPLKAKNVFIILTLCILIVCFGCVACFSVYPSPYIEQATSGTVSQDYGIYYWGEKYGTSNIEYIDSPLTRIYRIAPLISIYYSDIDNLDVMAELYRLKHNPVLSDHFGYTNNENYLAQIIGSMVFIPIREYDRIVYDQIYTKLDRMNSVDFSHLEADLSVNKIYSNKGYTDMYVTL